MASEQFDAVLAEAPPCPVWLTEASHAWAAGWDAAIRHATAAHAAEVEAAERDARRWREAPVGWQSPDDLRVMTDDAVRFDGKDTTRWKRVRLVPDGDACIGGGEG